MWLYGSGMPHGQNIGLSVDKKKGVDNRTGNIKTDGKATNSGSGCYHCNDGVDNSMKQEYEERVAQNEWKGWNTSLKPAFEPIIIARKPFKGTCTDNVMEYGVGAYNIEECRVGNNGGIKKDCSTCNSNNLVYGNGLNGGKVEQINKGRYPANVILTYDDETFEEVCGGFPITNGGGTKNLKQEKETIGMGLGSSITRYGTSNAPDNYGDSGSACRYFYSAKASNRDREEGLEAFDAMRGGDIQVSNRRKPRWSNT